MIWKPAALTRKQMTERRRQGGCWLKRTTLAKAEIARQLGVSRAAVSQWAKRMQRGGLRALHPRRASGRPRKLTHMPERELKHLLRYGALRAGFPTDRWTAPRIQKVICRKFRVKYHLNYLNRLLARWGFSLQQPLPRARERDEAAIRAWLAHAWPRIKKKRGERA